VLLVLPVVLVLVDIPAQLVLLAVDLFLFVVGEVATVIFSSANAVVAKPAINRAPANSGVMSFSVNAACKQINQETGPELRM
jgi:hypothetical protein